MTQINRREYLKYTGIGAVAAFVMPNLLFAETPQQEIILTPEQKKAGHDFLLGINDQTEKFEVIETPNKTINLHQCYFDLFKVGKMTYSEFNNNDNRHLKPLLKEVTKNIKEYETIHKIKAPKEQKKNLLIEWMQKARQIFLDYDLVYFENFRYDNIDMFVEGEKAQQQNKDYSSLQKIFPNLNKEEIFEVIRIYEQEGSNQGESRGSEAILINETAKLETFQKYKKDGFFNLPAFSGADYSESIKSTIAHERTHQILKKLLKFHSKDSKYNERTWPNLEYGLLFFDRKDIDEQANLTDQNGNAITGLVNNADIHELIAHTAGFQESIETHLPGLLITDLKQLQKITLTTDIGEKDFFFVLPEDFNTENDRGYTFASNYLLKLIKEIYDKKGKITELNDILNNIYEKTTDKNAVKNKANITPEIIALLKNLDTNDLSFIQDKFLEKAKKCINEIKNQ